jgi:hypothetical protein
MIGQVLSMGLSFLLLWGGRDKVWTPTFKGAPEQRFEQAVKHYKAKMGIDYELVFDLHPEERFAGDPQRCSSVEAAWISGDGPAGFEDAKVVAVPGVLVTWWGKGKGCSRQKPEFWALHEAAHIRMQHHLMNLPTELAEDEAKEMMVAYSAKERR